MVVIVPHKDWPLFQSQLDGMFRDRKRLFVDLMKWNVPVVEDVYERDEFDTPDAIYLMVLDPVDYRHLASLRMIPSTRPHMLAAVFPHLCETPPPIDDSTWEVTRLCTARHLRTQQRLDVRRQLMTAVVEFGLLYGISQYLCVVHAGLLSQLLAMGWDVTPLGLPKVLDDGELVGAHALAVRPATLSLFRQQWSQTSPMLTLNPRSIAA